MLPWWPITWRRNAFVRTQHFASWAYDAFFTLVHDQHDFGGFDDNAIQGPQKHTKWTHASMSKVRRRWTQCLKYHKWDIFWKELLISFLFYSSYELLDLTKPLEYLISTDGKLVSLAGKFSPLLDLGDFCIETAFLRSQLTFRSALICDPCSQRKCIQSCCSHLQMAQFDQSNRLVCQNPPGGSRSKFKFVPPGIPEKLGNFTLVKSDRRENGNCEVQNGTLVNTRDYHVSEDGSRVHVGKSDFFLALWSTPIS